MEFTVNTEIFGIIYAKNAVHMHMRSSTLFSQLSFIFWCIHTYRIWIDNFAQCTYPFIIFFFWPTSRNVLSTFRKYYPGPVGVQTAETVVHFVHFQVQTWRCITGVIIAKLLVSLRYVCSLLVSSVLLQVCTDIFSGTLLHNQGLVSSTDICT